ncbi:hypothetical protein CWI83_01265 [Pseudidiomarina taiwanensis]|uniref:LamB/YcsF family protein n=2 Tax=Pseudidiomarina taiwanensis TaxID=337250 RepID=A0A432ZP34_9GAMM|nr:hypothetical protein CWI83_01265 [Pseudidiomarina taiwanensis]
MAESADHGMVASDREVMPYIDMANIACGFHAGSAPTMLATIALAQQHGVELGAHPSYPDRENFGRTSMQLPAQELRALLLYQLGAMASLCRQANARLSYVKPHGALYNDMQNDRSLFRTVVESIASFNQNHGVSLYLVTLAHPDHAWQSEIAQQFNLALSFEAFADRRYQADGYLTPRRLAGAVLTDEAEILQQAQAFATGSPILCHDGSCLTITADTLCVHGDNPHAIATVSAIRQMLLSNDRS